MEYGPKRESPYKTVFPSGDQTPCKLAEGPNVKRDPTPVFESKYPDIVLR